MTDLIKIKSTSKNSALGQDIILRESNKTRLIFRPELVNNPRNDSAAVRGCFIFQSKKPSGLWGDYKTLDLSRLKDGEWIKLELHSEELYNLFSELDNYYKIYQKYGIQYGEKDFLVTPSNVKAVIVSFLKNPENFAKLQELKIEDLKKLNLISSINSLKNVFQFWQDNKSNGDESFWQKFFENNSWVIAQVFSYPVILFKEKAYLGGKTIENKGGELADFVFRSGFIENILVVEIKTPLTNLLGGKYRDSSYCLSKDLSGGISQLLSYKDEVQKNFFSLKNSNEKFYIFDPKCMLIMGNVTNELKDEKQKKSFELLRNDSKNVEIISYDELFKKVEMLIKLLES